MPLRKVHELAFLWFGLPGPLLTMGVPKGGESSFYALVGDNLSKGCVYKHALRDELLEPQSHMHERRVQQVEGMEHCQAKIYVISVACCVAHCSPCAPAEAHEFFNFWEGNLPGILVGFFRTHKYKAQTFLGNYRSIFREKIRASNKIFRANFIFRTCHPDPLHRMIRNDAAQW